MTPVKRSPRRFAWSRRPCTVRGQTEHTIPCKKRISVKYHPDRSKFGRMAAEKSVFYS